MQIVPLKFCHRYKKEHSVAFKIRQYPFSAGALPGTPLGSSRRSPRTPSRLERGTPPHTLPHSASTHFRRSPCFSRNSSQIYANGHISGFVWTTCLELLCKTASSQTCNCKSNVFTVTPPPRCYSGRVGFEATTRCSLRLSSFLQIRCMILWVCRWSFDSGLMQSMCHLIAVAASQSSNNLWAQHHRRPIISCDCCTCMEQSSYQHHSINFFAIFQETT